MKISEFAVNHGLKKKTVEYHVSKIKADKTLVDRKDGEYNITKKGVEALEKRLEKLITTNSVVDWKMACESREEELQSLRAENERLKLENESLKTYVSTHKLSEQFLHTISECLNLGTESNPKEDSHEIVRKGRGRPKGSKNKPKEEIPNEKDS